jgi:hypothetical protein
MEGKNMAKRNEYGIEQQPSKKTSPNESNWLDEEVYIEFYNVEEPGLTQKFSYGPTKNAKTYTLFHGGKYHLPRRVVQHLQSRSTPIYKFIPDGYGIMQKQMMGSKPRFQCREIFEERTPKIEKSMQVTQ